MSAGWNARAETKREVARREVDVVAAVEVEDGDERFIVPLRDVRDAFAVRRPLGPGEGALGEQLGFTRADIRPPQVAEAVTIGA